MKIKSIECEQFAGVQNGKLEFHDGLNIVIGDNESGKSTMIDLIYQILFKDVKLDKRSDSEFMNKYFPKTVSGPQGDVIDGVLVFETANGICKLTKEWKKGAGSCKLTVNGRPSITNNSTINEMLAEELKHRAGVYGEIVFASQKRNQIAVESIMRSLAKKTDSLSKTRADLASTLTQATLETGGVSLEKIEKALKENMNNLSGRWDRSADAPEGGATRASYKQRWEKGEPGGIVGLIVDAYYDMDEVRDMQAETEKAETAAEKIKVKIQELQKDKKKIETKKATFQKFMGMIRQSSLLSKAIERQEKEIAAQEEALKSWPRFAANLSTAKGLQEKQKQAAIRELYKKAQEAQQELNDVKTEFEALREVESEDINELKRLLLKQQQEESKLAGINLVAKIKQLGAVPIEVKSASSGNMLDIVDSEVSITETVEITVPGVLEIQLKPQGVDVEAVKDSIQQMESRIRTIYNKYGISDIGELQSWADAYAEKKQKVNGLKWKFDNILGEYTWDDIKAKNDTVPSDIETEAEIRQQITDLCGFKSVDTYIGGLEKTLEDYEKKYENIEKLRSTIRDVKEERNSNQKELASMDKIPEEFQGIENPDQYDSELQKEIDRYDSQIENCNSELREIKLGEKSAEEYLDELQEKMAVFESRKAEYEHWLNIYNVFCRLKKQIEGNPIEDIEEKFREYLSVITDGSLELGSMDNQMAVQLASGTHALTYDILSDGTKDTISVAFRLAMLEHLYPQGDGWVVFDDPFTDMDPKRVKQSCKLIQKFAEDNQVIFITCDEKYKELMVGNEIPVTK